MQTFQINVAHRGIGDLIWNDAHIPRTMKYVATLHLGNNTSITAYGMTPASAMKNAVINAPNTINHKVTGE